MQNLYFSEKQPRKSGFDIRDGLNCTEPVSRQGSFQRGNGKESHARDLHSGGRDERDPQYRDRDERDSHSGSRDERGPQYRGRDARDLHSGGRDERDPQYRDRYGGDSRSGGHDGRGSQYRSRYGGDLHNGGCDVRGSQYRSRYGGDSRSGDRDERDLHSGGRDGRGPQYRGRDEQDLHSGGRDGRDSHHVVDHSSGHYHHVRQGNFQVFSPPHVLNQLLSLFYVFLLQGHLVLETAIDTIRESNPRLYAEIRDFLQVSDRSLFDALQKVGLVQNPDGSWSAPESGSLLSSFQAFFASVIRAFSNSIFQFLNATLETRIVNVDGVLTKKYSFNILNGRIVAAIGVLFYSKEKGFLMQVVTDEKSGKIRLTDIGGKVEPNDMTCFHTLKRETCEETNGLLTPDYDFLKILLEYVHIQDSKYLLLICRAPAKFEGIDLSQFGTHEEHSSIERTVQWVSVKEFLDARNLHPRLSISPEVKAKISELCPP